LPDEALIQEATILALPYPKSGPLRELRYFTEIKLRGRIPEAGRVYGSRQHQDTQAKDLIALRELDNEDFFTEFVVERAIHWFHRYIGSRFVTSESDEDPLVVYKHRNVLRFTALFTTVIACLLPILSISILYSIGSMKARIGAMAGLNVLLTVCLALFATAKRVEIFAVTAA
jgi:hypothetical protein